MISAVKEYPSQHIDSVLSDIDYHDVKKSLKMGNIASSNTRQRIFITFSGFVEDGQRQTM